LKVRLPDSGFSNLRATAQKGICSGCGTCSTVCPLQLIEFEDNLPSIGDGLCLHDQFGSCGVCNLVCPNIESDITGVYDEGLQLETPAEEYPVQFHLGYAKDPKIRQQGQAGGVITALLAAGVKTGYLDAVTVVQGDKDLGARIVSANTREEIVAGAGTQYTRIPVVEGAWSLQKRHGKNFAFTGTPCMIKGMKRLQQIGYHDSTKSCTLIGVYCSKSFLADPLRRNILEATSRSAEDVSRIGIKGKVTIKFSDGEKHVVKLKSIIGAAQESCKYCDDFLAESADLSIGEMGAPPGQSVIIVRTQRGQDLLTNAQEAGELVLEPCDEKIIQILKKWAKKKRTEAHESRVPLADTKEPIRPIEVKT
jgi:coenzyme F420 hydrogenase subunit beta